MTDNALAFALGAWSAIGFGALCLGLSEMLSGRDEQKAEEDMDQLSMIEAMERKDDVLEDVASKHTGWIALANDAFSRLPAGWNGIGEDLRFALTERGVPPPKSPQVWGVFIGTLVKRGHLVATGERRPMRAPGSNGRKSDVYVRAAALEAAE